MAQRRRHWRPLHERRRHLHFHVASRSARQRACDVTGVAAGLREPPRCLSPRCESPKASPRRIGKHRAGRAAPRRCDTRFLNRQRQSAGSRSRRCNRPSSSSVAQCGAARSRTQPQQPAITSDVADHYGFASRVSLWSRTVPSMCGVHLRWVLGLPSSLYSAFVWTPPSVYLCISVSFIRTLSRLSSRPPSLALSHLSVCSRNLFVQSS